METQASPPNSTTSRFRELVDSRLVRAPKKIRKNISQEIPLNNFFVVSYSISNIYVALLLSKDIEQEVRMRAKAGMQPVPGLLIPADQKAPAAFAFESSHNILISNCTISGTYAFSIGANCKIIADRLSVSVTDELSKEYQTVVELGFIISGEKGKPIFNIDEVLDDLMAYYVSEKRV